MLNKISITLKEKKCVCVSLNSKFVSFFVNDRSFSSGLGQKGPSKPQFYKLQNQGSPKQASPVFVVKNKKRTKELRPEPSTCKGFSEKQLF